MARYMDIFKQLMSTEAPFNERISLDHMAKLVRRRDYRGFVDHWKAILAAVREQNMNMFVSGDQSYFTELFDLWFKVLEKPAFQLEQGDEVFFTFNANVTNLLAVTPHKNGDECMKKIQDQPDNMGKMLLLYTPRSRLEIPVAPLFQANPFLASLWYSCLWNWSDTYVHPIVQRNCRYFLESANAAFEPFDSDLICGYFRCTYVDNAKDRILKRIFNSAVRKYTQAAAIRNNPNPKSIALVSAYWNGKHAVYRAFAPYVEELAREYDLTLVNLTPPDKSREPPETSLFKKVYNIEASPAKIDITSITSNDFQLAYFPDVGMSQESVYLSNLRIAPIQCMGTGHPVSSASPFMDYFISGGEVETTDSPENNYDERLVLLPGLSVHPIKPKYQPRFPALPNEFIINCPWMHMKNNLDMAELLKRVYEQASRPVIFSLYPGCGATNNSSFMATIQDYRNFLPDGSYVIHPDYPYDTYMSTQEKGRFTLHSYPFGGGTTAVDALILGKPLVVRRGRHEYNRYSAALLHRIGLDELVADTADDWVRICVRLIDDSAYLEDVTRRVKEADLDANLFRVSDAAMLRRAFNELIKHDETLKKDTSRKPIAIG